MSDRHIVLHYHIFKNAGTSLDLTLRRNFGSRWASLESPERGILLSERELVDFLRRQPSIAAISSHTMTPLRSHPSGFAPISILFLRHPIDRARSIWEFNRRRPDDAPFSALAKRSGLAEYIELGLGGRQGGDASIAGHQSRWLARHGTGLTLMDRARDTLSDITVIGLVEAYAESVARLQRAAGPWFPGLRLRVLRANDTPVSANERILRALGRGETLDARLHQLRATIGPDLYRRLEEANEDDLLLWEGARASYGRRE